MLPFRIYFLFSSFLLTQCASQGHAFNFESAHVRMEKTNFSDNLIVYSDEWLQKPHQFRREIHDNLGNHIIYLYDGRRHIKYDPKKRIAFLESFETWPEVLTHDVSAHVVEKTPVVELNGREAYLFSETKTKESGKAFFLYWFDKRNMSLMKCIETQYSHDGEKLYQKVSKITYNFKADPDLFKLPRNVRVQPLRAEITLENLLSNEVLPSNEAELNRAFDILKEALDTDIERNVEITQKLGDIHALAGNIDLAISFTEQSLKLEENAPKYIVLANLYYLKFLKTSEKNSQLDVLKALEDGLRLGRGDLFVVFEAAVLYEKLGEYEKALNYYQEATEVAEHFESPYLEPEHLKEFKRKTIIDLRERYERVLSLYGKKKGKQ